MNDSATTDSADTTRRGLLRRGLALAVAAPALLSALHAAPAWANDDDHDDDDDDVRKQRGRDLFFYCDGDHRDLHSSPPRRAFSSSLGVVGLPGGLSSRA